MEDDYKYPWQIDGKTVYVNDFAVEKFPRLRRITFSLKSPNCFLEDVLLKRREACAINCVQRHTIRLNDENED